GDVVSWTEDLNGNGALDPNEDINNNGVLDTNALPAGFAAGGTTIGNVRVEVQDRRYTWLLTVRKDSGGVASVDVVVYFNRRFDSLLIDEALYTATFFNGDSQIKVNYQAGINPATNETYKPFMKKGNFMFDANNCFWYRITNVKDDPSG